jgi:hypothetical protein
MFPQTISRRPQYLRPSGVASLCCLLFFLLGSSAFSATVPNDEPSDSTQSISDLERALKVFRASGDRTDEATTLNDLGWAYDQFWIAARLPQKQSTTGSKKPHSD